MNRLIIIGAGGHGKVIADIALKNGHKNICFVDDHATGQVMGLPVIGMISQIRDLDDGDTEFVIGIGNNAVRNQISKQYDIPWATLIHPSAQIATGVSIGNGTVVMPNAVVNACAVIGRHCIINTGSIVEHDNKIGDFVHLSPGVKLSGTVTVGANTWIGTGASVTNNIEIGENVVVGVGSVVVKDIPEQGIYAGVPARRIQ